MNNRFVILLLVLFLSGCSISGPGQLYTNITRPYTRDFNRTVVGEKQCVSKEHRVREPVSGYGVTVEWSSDRIQEAAEKAGITKISCIDVQTVSFLLGIYTRRKLIIYGD